MKDLEGFEELANALMHMDKTLSDKELSKATRQGAEIVRKAIRSRAPVDFGDLRGGIILHKEKSRTKGKVGYDVYMDPKKNSMFQKPIMNPVRSKTPYGYYPASQEYGFFTRRADGGMTFTKSDGSAVTINKVPGKHYMLAGAETVGEVAKTEVGKAILEIVEKGLED